MNKIIVDTREQKQLFLGLTNKIITKLDEGDYCLEGLENYVVIERKSPSDFYGSIIGGHERFCKEILRAMHKNKKFYIFIECTREMFFSFKWSNRKLFMKRETLEKTVNTMVQKYDIEIVWCINRREMETKIINLLKIYHEELIGYSIDIF